MLVLGGRCKLGPLFPEALTAWVELVGCGDKVVR